MAKALDMRPLRMQAMQSVRWNGASMLAATVLQLTQTAVLARLLPPSEFGLMGLVLVATGFAQALSDFGLGGAIIYRQTSDQNELSSLYWANTLGGLLLCLVTIAISPLAAAAYHETVLTRLLPASALAFLISPLGQPMTAILQRDLRFKRLFYCEILSALCGATTSIFLAWKLQNAFALVWGQVVSAFFRSLTLWVFAGWRPSLRLRQVDLAPHLSFGLFQTGQRLVNFLAQNLDKLLIGGLLGTSALGYYTVAFQLMMRPMLLLNPVITRVALPIFSRMDGNLERIKSSFLEMIRLIAFVLMPLYLAMFVLADPLIQTLLGSAWRPAVPVFRALVLLGLLQGLSSPLDSIMLALGKAKMNFWFNVLALVLNAIVIPIGSVFGLTGIAYALVMAFAGIIIPSDLWILRAVSNTAPAEYFGAWLPFLGMGVVSAGLIYGLLNFLVGWPDLVVLALITISGTASYLTMIFLWDRPFLLRLSRMLAGGN